MNSFRVRRFARIAASAMALLGPGSSFSVLFKAPAASPKKAFSEGEGLRSGDLRGGGGATLTRWTTTGSLLAAAGGACFAGAGASLLATSLICGRGGAELCETLAGAGRFAKYAPA